MKFYDEINSTLSLSISPSLHPLQASASVDVGSLSKRLLLLLSVECREEGSSWIGRKKGMIDEFGINTLPYIQIFIPTGPISCSVIRSRDQNIVCRCPVDASQISWE